MVGTERTSNVIQQLDHEPYFLDHFIVAQELKPTAGQVLMERRVRGNAQTPQPDVMGVDCVQHARRFQSVLPRVCRRRAPA